MKSESGWILLIILMSYLMMVLDISIVITGLPKTSTDLHFSTASLLVGLPMILIGSGQGGSIGPLTVAGFTDLSQQDVGSTGLVNVAHQFGSSIGLAVLIVIFSSFQDHLLSLKGQLAHQISAALVGGAIMAAFAIQRFSEINIRIIICR